MKSEATAKAIADAEAGYDSYLSRAPKVLRAARVDAVDAARLLGMTKAEVMRLAKSGVIPCVQAKAEMLFSPELLRAWAIRESCKDSEAHKELELKVEGGIGPEGLEALAELLVDLAEADS